MVLLPSLHCCRLKLIGRDSQPLVGPTAHRCCCHGNNLLVLTDIHTHTQTDRYAGRQRDRQTEKQRADCQADRQFFLFSPLLPSLLSSYVLFPPLLSQGSTVYSMKAHMVLTNEKNSTLKGPLEIYKLMGQKLPPPASPSLQLPS